ncbi:MAG TPA: type II CAAX endopeptidase family protein [Saprospiraceae bacterium]|nr:type II CAAX endopeptidase family protein [Saprospiraceae bacterium]
MYPHMVVYDMNAWDHVVAVVICILAPILAFTSRKITIEDIRLDSADKIRLYHSNALLLIVFALVVTTTWRVPGRPIEGLGIEWPIWHPYVPLLMATIFLLYLLDLYVQYGNKKKRERTFRQKHKSFAFVPTEHKEMLHFVFLALAAGIGEEIIFRGFLIQYFIFWAGNNLSGILIASVISSLLFAFLHGYQGWSSMIKIFLFALLFSAIFIFSQSLLLVIIIHAIIDTMSGFISIYLVKRISEESE